MGLMTFQDFEKADDKVAFIESAISSYKSSEEYKLAETADEYDAQRNVTITRFMKVYYTAAGKAMPDNVSSNNQLASNFFNRLCTQRCMYSLGAGISFIDPFEAARGATDETKKKLGKHFDHVLKEAAYHALIHGCSYLFWDMDRVYEFSALEFLPLVDENDGSLRAGVRFWQLDDSKPLNAVLYEEDGFTKYRREDGKGLREVKEKRAYKLTYHYTDAGDTVSIDEENYVRLPVVRMYASRLKQSALVGMRSAIDAYDVIKSGFVNDVQDCAQIYWIVENYGGMTQNDLAKFLDRLKLNHIANADTQSGGKVTPYTQDVPTQSREVILANLRSGLYEDFGGLDVHTIAAGSTNDHIDAGYQPMDENAADFEHWVGEAVMQLLELQGIDDTPVFRRTKISNHTEQVQILMQEGQYLDSATVVRKLPNLTPEEAEAALQAKKEEDAERMGIMMQMQQGQVPQQVQPQQAQDGGDDEGE